MTTKYEKLEGLKRIESPSGGIGGIEDKIFLTGATSVGVVGIMWYLITRSILRHKYSEAVSYSIIFAGVLFSIILVFFRYIANLNKKNEDNKTSGWLKTIENIGGIMKKICIGCIYALLILGQLWVLGHIMYKHGEYVYLAESIPKFFNALNNLSIILIVAQCYVWYDTMLIMIHETGRKQHAMLLPGFILTVILSSIVISQLWVMLEFLKVDC
jgi:hypothetical protein